MIIIFNVIFNDDQTFNLAKWSNQEFNNNLTLLIIGSDINALKTACKNISKVEITVGDKVVATFTSFDSYNSITYMADYFCDELQEFTEVLSITLTRTNIIDQVQRLDE